MIRKFRPEHPDHPVAARAVCSSFCRYASHQAESSGARVSLPSRNPGAPTVMLDRTYFFTRA